MPAAGERRSRPGNCSPSGAMGAPSLKRLRRSVERERIPDDRDTPLVRRYVGEICTELTRPYREGGGRAQLWEITVKRSQCLFLPGAVAALILLAACSPLEVTTPTPTPPPTPTAVPVTVNLEDVGAVVVASPAAGPGNPSQIYVVTFD